VLVPKARSEPVADGLRIAVAGAGAFGREHLAALARRSDVTIAGVADPHPQARDSARADFRVAAAYADAIAMLDAASPDGLIVATPGPTHVNLAAAALERGIPVLVEKPVGMTAEDIAPLLALEAASRAFVLPGHILRFWEPYCRLAEVIRSGELGPVLSVTGRKHRDESHAVRYPDVDPVLMTMIHDIDLMLWMTGSVLETVYALRNPSDSFRSETFVTGRDGAGALWNLSNAWSLPDACPPDRVEVVCVGGTAELVVGEAIRIRGAGARTIEFGGATADDMLDAEIGHFLGGVRKGAHPGVVTLADARNGLAISDAILRSLASGGLERV